MSHPPPPPDPQQPRRSGGAFPPASGQGGSSDAPGYQPYPGSSPPGSAPYEAGQPQQGYPAFGAGPGASGVPPTEVKRPGTVLAGCILAWVGSVFGLLLGVLFLSLSENSSVFDDLDGDMNRADLVDALRITGGVLLAWCLVVFVLAVLAFRGAKWAAITLVVMAGVMAAFGLIGVVSGSGQGVLGLLWAAASATLIYLNRPAKQWYAAVADRRAATR